MKHPAFFIACFLAFVSCTGKSTYDLRGKISDPSLNGRQICIMGQSPDYTSAAIDSAIIEDGQFKLKGNVDSADWYMLVIKDPQGNPMIMKDFYVEGKLTVNLSDKQLRITGGSVNDAYQAFEDQYVKLTKDVVKLNNQLRADPNNPVLQKSFSDAYQQFEAKFRELAIKTIKANIKNPLGVHLLKSTAASLQDADIESILLLGDKNFYKDPFVQALQNQLNQAKKVAIGQPYVDMAMFSAQGDTVTLSNYVANGKYVLIDFWASWCGPCMKELPNLLACYAKFHKQGFDVVGVSLDEQAAEWKKAIQQHKLPWPQLSDLAGWKSTAVALYAFSSIPHTVLVDPNGIIIENDLRGPALEKKLSEIFARKK